MANDHGILEVRIAAPAEHAARIAQLLVTERLAACAQVKARTGLAVAFPNVGSRRNSERLAARVAALDGHAGLYETAMVLAVSPELVVGHGELPDVEASLASGIVAGATCFEEAGGPRGYFGQPARATAAIGNALLDELGAILAEATERG